MKEALKDASDSSFTRTGVGAKNVFCCLFPLYVINF